MLRGRDFGALLAVRALTVRHSLLIALLHVPLAEAPASTSHVDQRSWERLQKHESVPGTTAKAADSSLPRADCRLWLLLVAAMGQGGSEREALTALA